MERDLLQELFQRVTGLYLGKYRGVVVDNEDGTDRGRLQVKVPAVLGDNAVWALPCVPYAGNGVGFYCLPPAGTGVWVEFEAGDPSYAIWSGCFWRDGELPDPGGPAIKIWRTDKVKLRIDDDDADGELLLENASDVAITLAADIESKVGSVTHTVATDGIVGSAGAGKVEITSASVSVNGGALEIT